MKKIVYIAIIILLFSTAVVEVTASSNNSSGTPLEPSRSFLVYEGVQEEKIVESISESNPHSVDELVRRYGRPGITPASPSIATSKRVRDYPATLPTTPVIGNRTILVILIDFSDQTGSKNHPHYQNLLFGEEKGSLKDYYREVSYGQLTVQGNVSGTGWYRSSRNMTWWGADGGGHDDLNEDIFELAREAVILAANVTNFEDYDTNDNNVLDPEELSICIVHAGLGQESPGANRWYIWSHRWYIYGQGYSSNGSPLSDTFVDGVRISNHPDDDVGGYFMVAEDSPLGTFAHEFGHELGLPDLYDTSDSGDFFVGKWGLMAGGNWNGDPRGSSPAHLMAWCKLKLGWIRASNITSISSKQDVNVTVNRLETVTSGFYAVEVVVGSVYYLVEVRQQVLYDAYLPNQGVLISYCDDSIESGQGPVRVQNANPSVPNLDNATFNVGAGKNSTFIDGARGVVITVLSSRDPSFDVKVNYKASSITIQTLPVGLQVEVNGTVYTTPKTFNWIAGTNFTVNALSPQTWDSGTRFVFVNWSDGGAQSHTLTTNTSDYTLTATYKVQYYLNTSSPHGEVTGAGWYDNGSIAYTRLNTSIVYTGEGSRLRFSHWGGNASGTDFNRSSPILMGGPRVVTASWKWQYEVSLSFKTNDGLVDVYPSQCIIVGAAPNSTTLTLRSYSNLWLDNVSWTLLQVLWQGNNVVPNTTVSYVPQPLGAWAVNCSIYQVDFTKSFRDGDGDSLYVNPSHFSIIFPNNTLSSSLNPRLPLYLQNGTCELYAVYWQGSNIVPEVHPTFNSSGGNPTFNCRVYTLTLSFKDHDGNQLYSNPSSYTIGFSNGTQFTGRTASSYSQVQNGSISLNAVTWQGSDVTPADNEFSLTESSTQNVRCKVYKISFVNSFKDGNGMALDVNPTHFSLICPNGTEISPLSIGNYSLQIGSYNWSHIFWKGIDVTPHPTKSFNPVHGNPTVNCTIYSLVVKVEDYLGFAVSDALIDVVYLSNETIFASTTTDSTGRAQISLLPEGNYRVNIVFLGLEARKTVELVGDKTLNIKVTLSYPVIGLLVVPLIAVVLVLIFIKRRFRG